MAWKNIQYENGKMRTSESGSGGVSNFADLEDVDLSNLQDGQVPKYNSSTQKWENAEITDNNYINCSDCSTISSIFETIMQGQSKLKSTAYGVGNIGTLQNTNLKTLLGNPNLTNYVHAYIRPIVSGSNFMKLAEVYAVSTVNSQSAIKRKYIWMSQSTASQSAWETINYMT